MASTEQNPGRPGLPREAEKEILETLSENMRISSNEITAILKKHDVCADVDVLQDRYRRRLGQRLMAALRDENGQREVLAVGREYVVVDCCNDLQQLQRLQHRLQGQMAGLDVSTKKVRGRVRVLGRLRQHFRETG